MAEEKKRADQIFGKTVVSKDGKKYGIVSDLSFEIRTGELIYLTIKDPTEHAKSLDLEKNKKGQFLIPFSAVVATGDFVVVAEEDIV